jgi:hypothetical protein
LSQRLDLKSSPESFHMIWAVLVGWLAIAGCLYAMIGLPVAVFVTFLFVLVGVIPLTAKLLGQRRVRMDRAADTVRVRQSFRERVLCRTSDILAVQVVGDTDRYELNLVLGERRRLNLAAIQSSDNRKLLLQQARQVASFLEVPLVDQVEAIAVVGPSGGVVPIGIEPEGTGRAEEWSAADPGLAEPVVVEKGEQLPVRLRGSLWASLPPNAGRLYSIQGKLLVHDNPKWQSMVLTIALINFLLVGLAITYFYGYLGGLVVAAIAVVWTTASAVAALFSKRRRQRLLGVAVELSAHPLQAGEGHEVVIACANPRVLKDANLELVQMEIALVKQLLAVEAPDRLEKYTKAGMQGALRMTLGIELLRQPIALAPTEGPPGVRRGRVKVPAAPGSFGMSKRPRLWCLALRLGRKSGLTALYPVTIQPPVAASTPDGE